MEKKMKKTNALKKDDYIKHVASQLVQEMEKAGTNWIKPFISQGMPRRLNALNTKNQYYRGGNIFWLSLVKKTKKFNSNVWGTAKQIKSMGGEILEDQHATQVYFWQPYTFETTAKRNSTNYKKGDKKIGSSVFIKFFWVYNLDQTTLKGKFQETAEGAASLEAVEAYVNNTGANIQDGYDSCFYSPIKDLIGMVDKKDFNSTGASSATENYYSTLLHELTHWTAHKDRCDRDLTGRFGDASYAFEELIAEMGAAIQCCLLGVSSKPKKESAQYLNGWIKKIKDDPNAIFKAMSLADKAVRYLENLQEAKQKAA